MALTVQCLLESGLIKRPLFVAGLAEHRVTVLGQFLQVVQQVHIQEFASWFFGASVALA